MATKEITKQNSRYDEPELVHELVVEAEDASVSRRTTIARLTLLWQHRQFLFRCLAVGLVVSIIGVLLIPARYTSTTRLMPPDQAGAGLASMLSALSKAGGELGALGSDLLGIRTSSDLFVGIVHSRTIQDQLINKFDLRKVYGVRRWEDARKQLGDRTDVSTDRKSGITTIKVSDRNPQRAAEMAREYAVGLNRIVLTLNVSSAHKERVFLEERLGEVQKDLEGAEKDFSIFASKNTAIDVKEQGKAMIGAAAEIEGQLIATQTELEGMRQIYTPNNVRVRSLQARVDEFRRQLQKMGGKTPDSSGADSSNDLYPSIRELPILGVTYADLYRRAKVQEVVFETLTKQYEMAKVEEARETPSVKILDEGEIPERKSFPPRTLFTVLGIFLFLLCGAFWVLGLDRWQRVDARDPGKALAVEVWQTIASRLPWLQRRGSGGMHTGHDLSQISKE